MGVVADLQRTGKLLNPEPVAGLQPTTEDPVPEALVDAIDERQRRDRFDRRSRAHMETPEATRGIADSSDRPSRGKIYDRLYMTVNQFLESVEIRGVRR